MTAQVSCLVKRSYVPYCTVRCSVSRFGVLEVGCGNFRWLYSWKFSGMPLICLCRFHKKHCFSGVERGDRWYILFILIRCSHWRKGWFRHKITDFTTNFAEISQNGMSLVVMGLRAASDGRLWHIFCAHFGQECPNGFLLFVLNGFRNALEVTDCLWV